MAWYKVTPQNAKKNSNAISLLKVNFSQELYNEQLKWIFQIDDYFDEGWMEWIAVTNCNFQTWLICC
jgi:hypothetical protein